MHYSLARTAARHSAAFASRDEQWISRSGTDAANVAPRLRPPNSRQRNDNHERWARSGGGCNDVSVDLCRGAPAEDLAGPSVHLDSDGVELFAGDQPEVGALGEVLA